MKTCLLFAAILVWVTTLGLVQGKPPWFCRNRDCPSYTIVQSSPSYDIRLYGETKWLSMSRQTSKPWLSMLQLRPMFMKLWPYFKGEKNGEGRVIEMAVPALYKIQKRGSNDYTVSLMLYVADSNPPAPTGAGVTLVTRPAGEVYIKDFQEIIWPRNQVFGPLYDKLKKAIGNSASYQSDVYYRASYNYPFDTRKKQHEVWVDKI